MIHPVPIRIIAQASLLEMRRRKDLAVLGLFMALFLVWITIARFVGFEHAAAGTFLLNLSLTVITGIMYLLTLSTGIRQLPQELETGTLYPLLARPVSRSDILLGKWCAGSMTGFGGFLLLSFPAWLLIPKLEPYSHATLVQLVLLQPFAFAMIAACGLCTSMLLPRLPGLLIAGLLVFGTGFVQRLLRNALVTHALPYPGRLNLVLRYTDGIGPLPWHNFLLLCVYGAIWTALMLGLAAFLFQRKQL